MEEKDKSDFISEICEIITVFIQCAQNYQDEISVALIAVIAQIILFYRKGVRKIAENTAYMKTEEIIDLQVHILRECILDLEKGKEQITKGETLQ